MGLHRKSKLSRVLNYIQMAGSEGVGADEICKGLGIKPSNLYNMIVRIRAMGYKVETVDRNLRDGKKGRYVIEGEPQGGQYV